MMVEISESLCAVSVSLSLFHSYNIGTLILSLDLSNSNLYLDRRIEGTFSFYNSYDTDKFKSINAHNNGRLYPKDDLEAFGYMLYFLLNHGLPNAKGNASREITDTDLKKGKNQEFSLVYNFHCSSKYTA